MTMRPFPRRTHLFSSPSSSSYPQFLQINKFSASQNHSSRSRRNEAVSESEESRNVKVSVWWDFENCHVPAGVNVLTVAHNISAAVRANGMKGSIEITAFGDMDQLSRPNQEALSATGIALTHIPTGGKNSADRSLFIDLMDWVSENPPPAHLFLISGDRDFANILHRLRMNNYNILLASTVAPEFLSSAATILWNWQHLVRGQGLAGRHCNRLPDGPHGSWYGHCKAPREEKRDSFDLCLDPKVSLAPRSFLKHHMSGGITRKTVKPVDQKQEEQNIKATETSVTDIKSVTNVVETKEGMLTSVEVQEPSEDGNTIVEVDDSVLTSMDRQNLSPENGFWRKIRRWWLGDDLRSKEPK